MNTQGTVQVGRAHTVTGPLLRAALKLDAVVSGANAVAFVAGATLLGSDPV